MSKGNIIIIEDEFFAAEHLSDLVKSFGFTVEEIYHSGENFLKETDWNFDAAIVDIFLSGKLTGLDLAVQLTENHKPFIFLTANQDAQTLKRAAMLSPVSYLSKPFKNNDVAVALEIISFKLTPKIKIKGNKGMEEIDPQKILFVKSDGAYIEIYIANKKIVQRKLLKEIEKKLPKSFIRVHRSYLVNKNYIKYKSATHITIREFKIPISRNYKNNFM